MAARHLHVRERVLRLKATASTTIPTNATRATHTTERAVHALSTKAAHQPLTQTLTTYTTHRTLIEPLTTEDLITYASVTVTAIAVVAVGAGAARCRPRLAAQTRIERVEGHATIYRDLTYK